jgi:general secretion pathway protein I
LTFASLVSRPVGSECQIRSTSGRRANAGFTLIEVLVALSIVAVVLTAIGSVVAATTRSTWHMEQRFSLAETGRAVEAALPARTELAVGRLAGTIRGYRWQVDVLPFNANFDQEQASGRWVPQAIVIHLQSPSGQVLNVRTIRLRRATDQ